MITGFNTDINFQGVTYHVQTEDKGLATPLILSLVYHRGTILASKRSPYDDLVTNGFDEKILSERLQKQHKIICAAIRAGRIEELKEMTAKESAARRKESAAAEEKNFSQPKTETSTKNQNAANGELKTNGNAALPAGNKIPHISEENMSVQTVSNAANKVSVYKGGESPIPKPRYDFDVNSKTGQTMPDEELIIEAVEVIEDEMILPDEAVEVVTESDNNKLRLKILGDESFKSGEKKAMSILVHRGGQQNGLSGAQVMVKVLGAAFRPLIFHGKTDTKGIAKVHMQMPLFKQGRAAILIKAMSDGEEIELRRTIKHR